MSHFILVLFLTIQHTNTSLHLGWLLYLNDDGENRLISYVVLTRSRQDLYNKEEEKTLQRIPVWYWPNTLRRLSQKTFTTLECHNWGKLCVPYFLRVLGFYSSVEPTFVSWLGRCFIVGKILINVCILWDSSHIGIPLTRVNHRVQDISIQGSLETT